MKRFIDPSARPAMTGRYRQAEAQPAREQELTPEQKAALESWSKRPLPPLPKRWRESPEVVFIPEREAL
jgi:hypothetical protein